MRPIDDLNSLTKHLADDPAAAEMLRLADIYMDQQKRLGKEFQLPGDHQHLGPLIQKYGNNFPKFVSYVKELRDAAQPRQAPYVALHDLYRTLIVRLTQQERRDRSRRALTWLEKRVPRMPYEQKMKWLRKLEQSWGRRRMQMMEEYRNKTKSGRLNTDEREELLAEFWQGIDEEIRKGQLPKP